MAKSVSVFMPQWNKVRECNLSERNQVVSEIFKHDPEEALNMKMEEPTTTKENNFNKTKHVPGFL